ncbi:MAG: hypothetical protein AAF196_12995 [Planctomycetota bacterium]
MTRTRVLWLASAALLALALASMQSCSSTPRRDPTGERFPTVEGEALSGETVTVPDDLLGAPALLMVGYLQKTQFDLDRWLTGLEFAKRDGRLPADLQVREMPTIENLFARMAGGFIDEGMRGGIPKEDWSAVVTVYGDASSIVEFTGDEDGNNGRVLLLDREGTVVWFHDRGFSSGKLGELLNALDAMNPSASQESEPAGR